jgi:hypothetical protein
MLFFDADQNAPVVSSGYSLTRFLAKRSDLSKSSEMYPIGQYLGNIPGAISGSRFENGKCPQ